MLTTQTYTRAELPVVAQKLLNRYVSSRVLCFSGQLGAGKTTLIAEICRLLGYSGEVTSPTFGLVHEYAGLAGPIYHFDLYRPQSEDELLEIGMDEYLESGRYCLIEWPERILHWLPAGAVHFSLQVVDDGTRKLEAQLYL